MNECIRVFLLAIVAVASEAAVAHTPMESNTVLRVMLGRAAKYASDDNWSGDTKIVSPDNDVSTLRSFVSGWNPPGWTFDECKGVFDWYLSSLATNDVRTMTPRAIWLAQIALKQCEDLDYTNAVSAITAIALNTNGVFRCQAVNLAVKFSSISEQSTFLVESIFTNDFVYTKIERGVAAGLYATKIKNLKPEDNVVQSDVYGAVDMLYRNRMRCVAACYPIDDILCAKIAGYAVSSNRLETAMFILSNEDADAETKSDFISITNQLLSSGQPLRWINVGGTYQ